MIMMKIIVAVIAAAAGSWLGSRWISCLYLQRQEILSFPHKIQDQNQCRLYFLPACLGIPFAFYLLSASIEIPTAFFPLFYIYFLVLFTVTDWEQQVIFDNMLIPFALMGIVAALSSDASLLNHLLAALGGGFLFLFLAILTKGGIGGGDIKLIAALGLWLGTSSLLMVIATGIIMGGIAALCMLLSGHKKRTDTFAYGPYFAIAALLLLFH
ncbi:leader peptidase (prepilin peptidase) / N-methyltransferase [Selenomonas ruminantium]|uniref:Leader peptidase (Prepilin peptidase) / N-methyltransferase n=1 Tax=Selenomonas ruminantium TaxID=971 RepID=A0A1M6U177_SELRU|nr:A24 family peptidase [Selenomonas ruminantium]SHK62894.1 leader peptidase (prepilin peptidase) / N-methyltransferase [Selenomonas ruminantium]